MTTILLIIWIVGAMSIVVIAKSRWWRFAAALMLVAFYFAMPFGGGFYNDAYPMASDVVLFTSHLENEMKANQSETVSRTLIIFNEKFNSVAMDTDRRHKFIKDLIQMNPTKSDKEAEAIKACVTDKEE